MVRSPGSGKGGDQGGGSEDKGAARGKIRWPNPGVRNREPGAWLPARPPKVKPEKLPQGRCGGRSPGKGPGWPLRLRLRGQAGLQAPEAQEPGLPPAPATAP